MKFDLKLEDAYVRAAFKRLLATGKDLKPILRSIGEELVNSTKRRFHKEEAPDGSKWALLTGLALGRAGRR